MKPETRWELYGWLFLAAAIACFVWAVWLSLGGMSR